MIPMTNIKAKRGNSVSGHFKQVFSVDLVIVKALCGNKVKSSSNSRWDTMTRATHPPAPHHLLQAEMDSVLQNKICRTCWVNCWF